MWKFGKIGISGIVGNKKNFRSYPDFLIIPTISGKVDNYGLLLKKGRDNFSRYSVFDHYEGRQDLGDGDGSLMEHIEQYHTYYLNDKEWENYLLRNEGKEALEADKEHRAMLLNEFIPYLKLHCSLSEMERTAGEALQNGDNLTPKHISLLCGHIPQGDSPFFHIGRCMVYSFYFFLL